MRQSIISIFLIISINTFAQFVNIPDAKLKTKLIALYPDCFNTSGQMDTTCNAVINASTLDISNLQISSIEGIQYFDKLKNLYCQTNSITYLPKLPLSLNYLYCYYNQITSLPSLPNNLVALECYNNLISSLPTLPNMLQILHCGNNKIGALPELPTSLAYLTCFGNNISVLPTLPYNLWTLNCNTNNISNLPNLPSTLTTLSCSMNKLTSLPSLPAGLTKLDASYNCLNPVPSNPRPGTLVDFKVSPNSSNCVTSVDDANMNQHDILYPNPFKDDLHIGTTGELKLYQPNGEAVLHQFVTNGNIINISKLKSGLYYYSIGNQSGKIVKE